MKLICYICPYQVWASKWNERAYFSTRKVKLDHDYLCMAVLVQEVINADYAFVIHTTNPSSGDSSEIYAEVLCLYQAICLSHLVLQSFYQNEARVFDFALSIGIGGKGTWRNSSWSLSWSCFEFYLQEKWFELSWGKIRFIYFTRDVI